MPVDISEYSHLAKDASGASIPAGKEPAHATQQLIPGVSSAQSAAFGGATTLIRLHTSEAIRVKFGEDPTADATSPRVAANVTEYFGVAPGMKVAVISAT